MGNDKKVEVVFSAVDNLTWTVAKIAAAVGGVAAVFELLKESISGAAAQEDAEVKLGNALGRVSEELVTYAGNLQLTTKYADEVVISAMGSAAAFIKNEDAIKRVTAAAADFATSKGIDLVSATEMITKSVSGNVNILGRYGIAVEGAAGSSARLDSALAGLNARFGGAAVAAGNSFSGVWQKTKSQFDEVLESLGNLIVKNPVVVKALQLISEQFQKMARWLSDNQVALREMVKGGLIFVIDSLGAAVIVVGFFHKAWEALKVGVSGILYVLATGVYAFAALMQSTLLKPFDMLFDALVKIGAMNTNPFDTMVKGLGDFAAFEKDAFNGATKHADDVAAGYDAVTQSIANISNGLRDVNVTAATSVDGMISHANSTVAVRRWTLDQIRSAEALSAAADVQIAMATLSTDEVRSAAQLNLFKIQLDEKYRLLVEATDSELELAKVTNAKKNEMDAFQLEQMKRVTAARVAALSNAIGNVEGFAKQMSENGGKDARKYFSLYKTAATAKALIATYGAAVAAFESGSEINVYVGAAYAAAALAYGYAQVQSIRSQSFDGGGAGSSAGATIPSASGGPAPAVPSIRQNAADNKAVTHVTVNIHNPLSQQNWDEIVELDIIPAINSASGRGVALA